MAVVDNGGDLLEKAANFALLETLLAAHVVMEVSE